MNHLQVILAGGCCLALFVSIATCQEQTTWKGYSRTVHGSVLEYRSCQPDADSALLVRSLDSTEYMEWETEALPPTPQRDTATFVWIFGINGNLEARNFHLFINGTHCLTFARPVDLDQAEWAVRGENGSMLHFRRILIDKNRDLFGYAFLTVPPSVVVPGKSLRIRVQGETHGSRTWYMTFQYSLHDTIRVSPQEALLRKGSDGLQPIFVDIVHLGQSSSAMIQLSGGNKVATQLQFGFNRIVATMPAAATDHDVLVEVTIDKGKTTITHFVQKPIRKWTVYFVEHAHTDIGYTRPQTEILPEHLRFIDYALDYCDQTDSLPADAQFRWTCEASWPVSKYLQNRPPEQIERFKRRVHEGRIEVTGMMFNMSELSDENAYTTFLAPIRQFKQMGIPVSTAMQDDVNGAAWCLIDYFHDLGIRYLTMGQNADRALKPFDIPTSFWWESPSGNRLLAFRADHYMTGNFMGMERGQLDLVEPDLFGYLNNLEQHDYPFDRIAIQYSGYFTDNSAPSTSGCKVIDAWNRKYLWPHLRSATDHEFPEYVQTAHPNDIQSIRAAWPDWWTDGTESAPRETGAARRTQAAMIANKGLLAMARLAGVILPDGILDRCDEIMSDLLFYDEHTFGAAESITDPRVENSEVQWSEKCAYVWNAVKNSALLREYGLGLLQDRIARSSSPTITVFNTLSWSRSGLHIAYIDNQILPPEKKFQIVDVGGNIVPTQQLIRRADGTYWGLWVKDVPPFGYKTFRIETMSEPATSEQAETQVPQILENRYYRIAFDHQTGTMRSVFDKDLKRELIDSSSHWKAGQFIRETLTNREQIQQYRMDGFARSTLNHVHVKSWSDGVIWKSIEFSGESEGCTDSNGVTWEVRLYNLAKQVEVRYTMRKLPVTNPEAIYVAFPFALPGATIHYDAQGGVVIPGLSQIPGSSSDWQTVQNFAAVRNGTSQIIMGSDEAPLMQFGDINTGKFQRVAHIEQPHIYSWVMNNYWTTNFVAEEDGELKWTYYLTSTVDTTDAFAAQFGWGSRIPFVSRILPDGAGRGSTWETHYLQISPAHVFLVSATPARDGAHIILQLKEMDGKQASVPLKDLVVGAAVKSIVQVNVIGEEKGRITGSIDFKPYETKFVEVAE